jgi:hypothetical protein
LLWTPLADFEVRLYMGLLTLTHLYLTDYILTDLPKSNKNSIKSPPLLIPKEKSQSHEHHYSSQHRDVFSSGGYNEALNVVVDGA